MPTQILSKQDNYINALKNIYNVQDLYVKNKDNGISIIINTSEFFPKKNIATSINSDGWLNITLLNGIVDSLAVKQSQLIFPIIKSHVIQLDQSSQISLLCKQKIDDVSIISSKNNIEFLLSTQQNQNSQKIQNIRKKWIIDTIVLDPGHGGKDPGTMGTKRYSKYEKDIALSVSLKLGDYISNAFPDINVIYTRSKDVFLELIK